MTRSTDTAHWLDELVLELRLRDVRGPAIGEAVAVVEAHLADSGQSAQEAFGDPRGYAASLDFAPTDVTSGPRRAWLPYLLPSAFGFLGLTVTLAARDGWAHEAAAAITAGQLLAAAVLVAAAAAAYRFLDVLMHHTAVFAISYGTAFALMVGATVGWTRPALTTPATVTAVAGAVLLAASVITALCADTDGDRVVDPLQGQDRYASTSRLERLGSALTPWVWVIATLAIAAPLTFAAL